MMKLIVLAGDCQYPKDLILENLDIPKLHLTTTQNFFESDCWSHERNFVDDAEFARLKKRRILVPFTFIKNGEKYSFAKSECFGTKGLATSLEFATALKLKFRRKVKVIGFSSEKSEYKLFDTVCSENSYEEVLERIKEELK